MPALTPTPAQAVRQPPRRVSARATRTVGGGLLVAIPVVVFAVVWQYYAVNVPKWDDHALRAYLYYFDQEPTFAGKIYQLFRQHNEHRIVYDRLVALLDYWLFGKLSYVHLMVVGNLSLVGLLWVFSTVLLRAKKSLVYALPVALLLFNLSHWENMFWGMAALQNFSVVFWVVLTIYLLSHSNHWLPALATALLATLTSGNGLLVWPIGFVLLLLQTSVAAQRSAGVANRPLWLLPGWVVAAALVGALYFTGFEKPAGNPPDRASLTDLLRGWLAFTGAAAEAFSAGSPLPVSIRLGGLVVLATLGGLGWSVWTNRSGIAQVLQNPFGLGRRFAGAVRPGVATGSGLATAIPPVVLFFWGCAAFLLATAAIVAWTRTGFGIDLMITSRYKIYALTLLALLYVYALSSLPKRVGRWLGSAGAAGSFLLAWLSFNAFVDETIWWRHWMLTSQFNWTYGTSQPIGRLDAITRHYTSPAPAFYDAHPAVLYGAGQLPVVPVMMEKTPAGYVVRQATLGVQDGRDSRSFVVLRSPKRAYLFPTRQNQRLSLRTRCWPASPFSAGFTASIAPIDLDAGIYQLFVLTVAPGGLPTLHATGQTIASAGQPAAPLKKNW